MSVFWSTSVRMVGHSICLARIHRLGIVCTAGLCFALLSGCDYEGAHLIGCLSVEKPELDVAFCGVVSEEGAVWTQ